MKKLLLPLATASLTLFAVAANATPVTEPCAGEAVVNPICIYEYDTGSPPGTIGNYTMTAFGADPQHVDAVTGPQTGLVTSAQSVNPAITGQIDFEYQNQDPAMMLLGEQGWWQYPHGRVYSTSVNWIELVLPVNTRALSFYVGASFNGSGWLEAITASGAKRKATFGLAPGDTPGFGVHTTSACDSISRIIVDPQLWGVGNFAINQGSCTAVPEPGSATLLLLGLLGLGFRAIGSPRSALPRPGLRSHRHCACRETRPS